MNEYWPIPSMVRFAMQIERERTGTVNVLGPIGKVYWTLACTDEGDDLPRRVLGVITDSLGLTE
jgi:hypothetical protein